MTANASPPFDEPDTVTVFGDWHGNARWAAHALRRASSRGVKVGVHTGDLGVWPGRTGTAFANELGQALRELDMWLIVAPGNHDDYSQIDALPVNPDTGLQHLRERILLAPRGARWTWKGKEWLALGGATSVDRQWRTPMVDWWPREAITISEALRVAADGPADVMVTHDAPAGYRVPGIPPDGTFPEDAIRWAESHRELLTRVVENVRPKVLYHGHFHSRYTMQLGGLTVQGLDMDGSGDNNWMDVEL